MDDEAGTQPTGSAAGATAGSETPSRTTPSDATPTRAALPTHAPRHPDEAVGWLIGDRPSTVLALDGGSGLVAQLCALGHEVLTTGPTTADARATAAEVPGVHASVAVLPALPFRTGSVDVVLVEEPAPGSAEPSALTGSEAEVARVLRPGGVVATIGTRGDRKVPWVKKVYALAGIELTGPIGGDQAGGLGDTDVFEVDETSEVRHWETFRRHDLVGFVVTQPTTVGLDATARERLTISAEELYDSYGRGPDGLLMPWLTRCTRAKVAGLARGVGDDEPTERIVVPAPPQDDGLLIDFR